MLAWPFQNGRGNWTVFGGAWISIIGLCLVAGRGTRLKRYEIRRALRPSFLWRPALTFVVISAFLAGSVGNVEAATYNPVFYYYHTDHLGSSNVLTDRSGNVVQHYEYATFGQTSYQNNTSAFPVSNRYTGQIADDETGLLYYGGRYYDPQLGRFIQPDPTVPDPSDSQSFNRYSYCRNNPLNETDPSGFDDSDGGDGGSLNWNFYYPVNPYSYDPFSSSNPGESYNLFQSIGNMLGNLADTIGSGLSSLWDNTVSAFTGWL